MKIRKVVISLICVVAFVMVACSVSDPPDESSQEKKDAAPAIDSETKAAITKELSQAAGLLTKAKSELDQGTKEAEAQAKRFLGHPAFVLSDFLDPQGLAERLQSNRELSKYLFSEFAPANKELLKKARDEADTLTSVLREEFDQQLENRELYLESRFPKDNLTTETKAELQRNQPRINTLSPQELARLNRLLLQDSYKGFIKPVEAENVVRHLSKAQELTRTLSQPDIRSKTQSNIDEALEATRAVLNQAAAESDNSALLTAVDNVSKNVANASASLQGSNPSSPGWFEQVTQTLGDVLYYLLLILAVVIPLALIVFFIKRARDNTAARELANLQILKSLKDRHDKLQQEFNTFKNQNGAEIDALRDQVSRLDSVCRILTRKNEQSAEFAAAGNTPNFNRYYEPPPSPVREEPEFPVSAETYLQKMKGSNRSTTVIRPDFQNGILVKDGEGRGELVLVEDLNRPLDFQRLVVVPSVSQFQMKQDFYNYYDGYYECDQPTAGDVWIVHPAIVEKVTGGWRLTEKGRLEVR